MLIDESYKRAEGAYAVPRLGKKTVLIEVPEEDEGKREGALEWESLQLVTQGMFGIVSGKAKANESYSETLSRELFEEQQLYKLPELFSNSLPTAAIVQERPSGKYLFNAHGHRFDVTENDVAELRNRKQLQEIEDSQLLMFLIDRGHILRPSVHAILVLLYKHLEEGKEV